MNHASISPDGKLLLAVGDEPIAFFCRRIRLSSTASNGGVSRLYATYQWNEIARSKLRLTDSSDVCFSTAFSPSGHICAVASQSGIITIYDTALIHEDMDADEAVITVLKSSQPSFNPSFTGAVRSMSFSPAPWDLLAWAEDQGRLCVVDLRNACRSRQTIELKIDSPVLVRAEGEDHDTNSQQQLIEIERRYMQRHREALAAQDQLASASRTADQVELAAERRRIELDTERQMIPSIGLRPLVNHTNYSDTLLSTPISVNYNQTSARQTEPRDGTQPSSPSAQSRSTANIHEFMRQRNWERSRENERSHQPRRRGSVAISNSNSNSNTSAPYTFSLAPIGIETQNLSTSPARLPSNTSNEATTNDSTPINPADPWHTIADAMGSLNSPVDTVTRLRNLQSRNSERRMHSPQFPQAREQTMAEQVDGVEARVNRARDATARALRQMRAAHGRAGIMYDEIDREFILRRYQRSPRGVDAAVMTMGIGWNEDGRSL